MHRFSHACPYVVVFPAMLSPHLDGGHFFDVPMTITTTTTTTITTLSHALGCYHNLILYFVTYFHRITK